MQSNGQKKNEARLPSALVQGNWLNNLAFSGPLMPSWSATKANIHQVLGGPRQVRGTASWWISYTFHLAPNRGSVPAFSALWLCLLCILGPILETGCSFQQVLERRRFYQTIWASLQWLSVSWPTLSLFS